MNVSTVQFQHSELLLHPQQLVAAMHEGRVHEDDTRVAAALRDAGHDVVESRQVGPDPGDLRLLEWAVSQERILITLDTDFGRLIFREGRALRGINRLPDVPAERRMAIVMDVLQRYESDLSVGAVVTIRGARIRVSRAAD